MKTFKLPDLGEGLQDAEIVAWHVDVGERIAADQPLVSVETAKAVVEVPSPWSGQIVALHVKPGERLEVGAALADIETEGEVQDTGTVVGTLPAALPPTPAQQARPQAPAGPRPKMSPAVRQAALGRGLDPALLVGTGPGGAVMLADVESAAGKPPTADGYEPLRGVRRGMADALDRAAAVVAATVTDEAIVDHWPADADPTIRLIRAIVAGCAAAPELNASYDSSRKARSLHAQVDVGIAVETSDGLFAPVLRNAGGKTGAELRGSLELIKRGVAERKLAVADLQGASIALSNFGMLGGLTADLTILPPQVAILGAGRIHEAPRVLRGAIRIAKVLPLSLTFDHRAVTGAEAIRFLNAVIADLGRGGDE